MTSFFHRTSLNVMHNLFGIDRMSIEKILWSNPLRLVGDPVIVYVIRLNVVCFYSAAFHIIVTMCHQSSSKNLSQNGYLCSMPAGYRTVQ